MNLPSPGYMYIYIVTTSDEKRPRRVESEGKTRRETEREIKIFAGEWTDRQNFLICKTTAVWCHLLLVYSRDRNLKVNTINHPALRPNGRVGERTRSIVLSGFFFFKQMTKNGLTSSEWNVYICLHVQNKRNINKVVKIATSEKTNFGRDWQTKRKAKKSG